MRLLHKKSKHSLKDMLDQGTMENEYPIEPKFPSFRSIQMPQWYWTLLCPASVKETTLLHEDEDADEE
eukprot:6487829-Amphidinium_carterae.1